MKKVIITTGIVAVAGGIATVLLMPSCDPECVVQPKPSVILQFVGEPDEHAGINYVAADEVTFVWINDEGQQVSQKAECGDEECNDWLLGNGQGGTFEIHAKVCGAQVDKTVTVELNDEGCEVDTQIIQVPVDTAACTDIRAPETNPVPPDLDLKSGKTCTLEARPSVLVTVVNRVEDMMIPVHPDRVFYNWDGDTSGRTSSGICLNETCSQFAAGWEQAGVFTVGAEVCGKTSRTQVTVGKTHDDCHVETEFVLLEADVSGCNKPTDPAYEVPADLNCMPALWPSAIVLPVTDGGDVYLPHPTEDLFYTIDGGRAMPGHCAEKADNGKCRMWVTGWGQTGKFHAFTETCERRTEFAYAVHLAEDGCRPKTEFVPAFVDTTGCLTPPTPGGPDKPETPPAAGDVTP